jgi:hypothetical protein
MGIPPIITGGGSETNTENRAYAGLVWTLQDKMSAIPDLTLGFRSLRVKSTDSVNGVEVSTRIKLKEGISLDSTRLSYLGGERNVLGNVGLGYSFSSASLLGTIAVQGPYMRVGSDYQFSKRNFLPYLEVLTLGNPNKVQPKSGSISCPDGYWLDNGMCYTGESDIRLKQDIKQIATLKNGLKIYSFKYKSREGNFVGVMAQDLLANPKWSKAVVQRSDGFYLVNYRMLGIKMTNLENWKKFGEKSLTPA